MAHTNGAEPSDGRGKPSGNDTGASAGRDELADKLSSLARALEQEDDLAETLQAIVDTAIGTIPGAAHASISSVKARRDVETLAATSELARAADRAQYEAARGPCLDSLFEERTVRVPDFTADRRWPEFTSLAAGLGVQSMLAVQLYVHGDDLGALNLHSETLDAFDDDSEHVALLFASHAAVAMAGAQQLDTMQRAVDTRDLIGQAKGMLMERFGINGDRAFHLLARASQDQNRKLRDLAAELVRTGELAGSSADRSDGAQ